MKLLKYTVLILIMWGVPTFALNYINPTLGAITSYLTIALALLYYILEPDKKELMWPFIILGITYYSIAGLNYTENYMMTDYFPNFIKFILIVICCAEIARKTTLKELYIVLIFGALSVVCHAVFFSSMDAHFGSTYGRYSGFYLNPNYASIMCLFGFAISYSIKNQRLKLLGQLIFSFAGLLTLSRAFVAIWLLMNLMGVYKDRKNAYAPMIGVGVMILILSFGTGLKLNKSRFEALGSIFNKEQQVQTQTIGHDSRQATWATYYNVILDKPFFGNGFRKLQGGYFGLSAGVHNTYLLVIGEAGIIPLLILLGLTGTLFIRGLLNFKSRPEFFFLNLALLSSFLFGHTYFEKFSNIFFTLLLYTVLIESQKYKPEVQNG